KISKSGGAAIHMVLWMKVHLDETDPSQGTRFDMVNIRSLQIQLLEPESNRTLDLRGPHAFIECPHRHDGDINFWKDVDHHLLVRHDPKHDDNQTERNDRIGII